MAAQFFRSRIQWQWVSSLGVRTTPFVISLLVLPLPLLPVLARSAGEIAQTASPNLQDIRSLEVGKPLERDMAAGENHSYQVTVQAGQYLRVNVEQKGIDVEVKLLAPDGKELAKSDRPNGTVGPETVSAIAEVTGNYRIELKFWKKAGNSTRYEIAVSDLRTAKEEDKTYLTAQQVYQEGLQLRSQGTAESRLKAITKFSEALELYQNLGNTWGEANSLYYLGFTSSNLSENRQALRYYDRVLPLYRKLSNRWGENYVLNNTGIVYSALGERDKALEYYEQALSVQKQIDDRVGQAKTLTSIGLLYSYLGEQQKALEQYKQSLEILEKLGNNTARAYTLNSMALLYWSLSDREKALQYYNLALTLGRQQNEPSTIANSLNGIGAVYDDLAEYDKALQYYNEANAILNKAGDKAGEAVTLNNIGKAHFLLGNDRKALEFYEQALLKRRESGDRSGEAITLGNIGNVYLKLNQIEKALEYYDRGLPLARTTGNRQREASIIYGLANLERKRGNLLQALARIQENINIVEDLRTKVISQELRRSFFASVQNYYELYIVILMELSQEFPDRGYDRKALEVSERARARSLLDILKEANAEIREGVDPKLFQQEKKLQQKLEAKESLRVQLLNSKDAQPKIAELETEINDSIAKYEEVQAEIRAKSPRYAALTQPQPLTLPQIQQQVLDDDTILLEYSLGEERSYLWAVTKNNITSYELPSRQQIEIAAKQFREIITDPILSRDKSLVADRSARLSQIILAPVEAQLGKKRLLIVSDGILQYIPFAALSKSQPKEYAPLIVDNEIVSLPSASTLAILRKELSGRQRAKKTLALLADPVFNSTDERLTQNRAQNRNSETIPIIGANWLRLPFTRQEADAIATLVPSSQRLQIFGFQADRAAVTSPNLAKYRIVHFATHGLLDPDRPELSGLVLSLVDDRGIPQNGFLPIRDIFNLKLSADLVVLSACKTGSGKVIRGEGLVGLTRGFMYAGTPRLVASLWSVNDPATADLMSKFYQQMLTQKLPPASALRVAQLEMWRQQKWQSPYYWAAFNLQGEWK